MDLHDRAGVVTGAGSGIGRALAVELGRVDLLVNNAGNVRAGRLEQHEIRDVHAMIDLNLTAPILLTRALLPALRAAAPGNGGLILNIASGMALLGLPFYGVYAATKAGLARFGESLRRELHGTGLHVATSYPGATDTDMMTSTEAGEEYGMGLRPLAEVVGEIIAALAAGTHEINTSTPARQEVQRRNAIDPLAVDALLAPRLPGFEHAVRNHRTT
ncbi:SDR family NAD(P)-dependent oxidoreductase [Crossiella sp. CA198]|uniref:SDR family NAD(P)-dependent oxidoreductase n=1 Tax=Crossiella sp. CA198 TaxID=3455607 RepID=UPI003F8D8988